MPRRMLGGDEPVDRETPAARPMRMGTGRGTIPSDAARFCTGLLPAGLHVHVALLLDLHLLLADLAGDVLGVLHHPLADLDLFGHHRVLAHLDLLLADRDADSLA